MASAGALTREMMLEFSGEDKVEKVTILVLRGMGLSDVSALSLVPSRKSEPPLPSPERKLTEVCPQSRASLSRTTTSRQSRCPRAAFQCCSNST